MPTPVSALIHAATMVTAGVYLLIRSSPLIEYSSTILLLCLWLGALTTVFSSLVGLFQQDIKKVIAYSTMSEMAPIYYWNNSIQHQTICVEKLFRGGQGYASQLQIMINSQITKAHDYIKVKLNNHISINLFNSSLRVILTHVFLIAINVGPVYGYTNKKMKTVFLFLFFGGASSTFLVKSFLFYLSRYKDYKSPWLYYYRSIFINMSVRWKIITISKLVGISEAIRLILNLINLARSANLSLNAFVKPKFLTTIYIYNKIYSIFGYKNCNFHHELGYPQDQDTKSNKPFYSELAPVKSPSRGLCHAKKKNLEAGWVTPASFQEKSFFQWLGGLIDGDGSFILTKKGKSSLIITMDAKDKIVLFIIKQRLGGQIKYLSNANAVRYKLTHKKGLIQVLTNINGFIRHPARLLAFNKLCLKYNIEAKYPDHLTYKDGWFSGILDSDGSIHYDEKLDLLSISVTQKNKYLLDPLMNIHGGRIMMLSPKKEGFKYEIYRKVDLFNLMNGYLKFHPLKTTKNKRLNLIKEFFLVKGYNKDPDIVKYNKWVEFKDKWDKS